MPLTSEHKTEIEAVKERLQIRLDEVSNLKSQLKNIINCAYEILQDDPQDDALKTTLTDIRLESLRQHVINKGAILAPDGN